MLNHEGAARKVSRRVNSEVFLELLEFLKNLDIVVAFSLRGGVVDDVEGGLLYI